MSNMEAEPQSPAPQKHVRAIVDPKRARPTTGAAQLGAASSTFNDDMGMMGKPAKHAQADCGNGACRRLEQEPESEGKCNGGKLVGPHNWHRIIGVDATALHAACTDPAASCICRRSRFKTPRRNPMALNCGPCARSDAATAVW